MKWKQFVSILFLSIFSTSYPLLGHSIVFKNLTSHSLIYFLSNSIHSIDFLNLNNCIFQFIGIVVWFFLQYVCSFLYLNDYNGFIFMLLKSTQINVVHFTFCVRLWAYEVLLGIFYLCCFAWFSFIVSSLSMYFVIFSHSGWHIFLIHSIILSKDRLNFNSYKEDSNFFWHLLLPPPTLKHYIPWNYLLMKFMS